MAKKINNYSWIHELNRAALSAQLLGEAKIYQMQILNETRRKVEKNVGRGSMGAGGAREVAPGIRQDPGRRGFDLPPDELARQSQIARMKRAKYGGGEEKERYASGIGGDEEEGISEPPLSRVPPTRLGTIEAGQFPPPSPQHPAPMYPTPEAAAAAVRAFNAARDLEVRDVNRDGTANAEDVKMDARNNVMGDEAVRQFFRASDLDFKLAQLLKRRRMR